MSNHSTIHRRHSVRLQGYDYSEQGGYFVTICTNNKECIFGNIMNGEMRLNNIGTMVREEWLKTPTIRPNVELNDFVVMPNHFHGILILKNIDDVGQFGFVGAYCDTPPKNRGREKDQKGANVNSPLQSPSQTIGAIVRGFKSTTTKRINQLRNMPKTPVWQRNYYEHIIRDEDDLMRIREYVRNNVLQWQYDRENPDNRSAKSVKR